MAEKQKFENPTPKVHHELALWAASCAEHVLYLFEGRQPNDNRPRQAIKALREWVRGERSMVSCREAAFAAHAAAREAKDPVATAAARAAGQAVAVAHMFTHAPHAADYAAKAVKLSSSKEDAKNAWATERVWQWNELSEDLRTIGFPNGQSATTKIK